MQAIPLFILTRQKGAASLNNSSAVQKFVNKWREIYKNDHPLEAMKRIDGEFPAKLIKEMEEPSLVFPQPFYGPFGQDMTNDLLVLIMNPGEVKLPEIYAPKINAASIERYTRWQRSDFLQECGRFDQKKIKIPSTKKICDSSCILNELSWDGCRWRRTRYREAKFDMKLSFDMLNTLAYIPYHAKRFNKLDKNIKNWLFHTYTSQLAFDAICEIANNHLVKYIVGLGGAWIDVFKEHGYDPVENISYKNSNDSILGRLVKFQISDTAMPIVIHLIPNGTKFPSQKNIIDEMRKMLGEPIIH